MPDSPFDIDGATWQPVSRKLIHVRTWIVAVCLGLPTLLGIALAAGVTPWLWIAPALTTLALVWALWLIRRQVPAIGTANSPMNSPSAGDNVQDAHPVPYGRMQYIEVDSAARAEIRHRHGHLHTASASSDAQIPGLPEAEATRLRDRLSKRSESMLAGL